MKKQFYNKNNCLIASNGKEILHITEKKQYLYLFSYSFIK